MSIPSAWATPARVKAPLKAALARLLHTLSDRLDPKAHIERIKASPKPAPMWLAPIGFRAATQEVIDHAQWINFKHTAEEPSETQLAEAQAVPSREREAMKQFIRPVRGRGGRGRGDYLQTEIEPMDWEEREKRALERLELANARIKAQQDALDVDYRRGVLTPQQRWIAQRSLTGAQQDPRSQDHSG
jgi:hypothetical protein